MSDDKITFFLDYPNIPGEDAVDGIRFDFCDGCRILFPYGIGEHDVELLDNDTGTVIQKTHCCDGAKFRSNIRYYVNWGVRIYRDGVLVFSHDMDLAGKEVLFTVCSGALGDNLAWIPLACEFAYKYKCKAGIQCNKQFKELMDKNYPDLAFFENEGNALSPYAKYLMGVNFLVDRRLQKRDCHCVSLQQCVACDIGLEGIGEIRPRVNCEGERIYGDYVCIAFDASAKRKRWNNDKAMDETVQWLHNRGYRVFCIDKHADNLHGAEDMTGDRPLAERAMTLFHARAFVGLPSGLSWLAWSVFCKVIMVSGFSEPWSEFYTPYRVQNANVCHGCWNDVRCTGNGIDETCPRNKDFECTRFITSNMVISQLKKALGEK